MEKKALTYTLEIARHDDGYLAYFPALPGCNTWGKTCEDAVKHAEEALIGFLEALQKNGEEIPVEHPSAENTEASWTERRALRETVVNGRYFAH
jgi:antitoxin HicB